MFELDVWPGNAPGDYGEIGEEHFREPWSEEAKSARWLTNVTKPTLTVYPAPKDHNTGAAMIICPGGGYWNLAWDLEGEEVAAWLNSVGITGILLKYRVPRRPGQPEKLPAPGPILDAQRAVSLARSNAVAWGINPHRIGMVGFSAGGHLVAMTSTGFESRTYEPVDGADSASCRPEFAVMCYSGYLIDDDTGILAPYIQIPAGMPPCFLAHAADDPVSNVAHSVVMHLALIRAGIPAELHVYATGGHGFGVRPGPRPVSTWTSRCVDWLTDLGVMD